MVVVTCLEDLVVEEEVDSPVYSEAQVVVVVDWAVCLANSAKEEEVVVEDSEVRLFTFFNFVFRLFMRNGIFYCLKEHWKILLG